MRKLMLLFTAGTLGVLLAGSTTLAADDSSAAQMNQTAKHFTFEKTTKTDLQYLLFLPKGYEATGEKKWPLMLFLHGSGERGTDVWKVATHGPPNCVKSNPDFPFIAVSPQCPAGQIWSNEPLLALLDDIIRNYAVDTHRVYLTGLSMGGYGTWGLGMAHPERFAAIAPICGGGEFITPLLLSRDQQKAFQSLGIWAFHGAKDPVVPVAESERMVEMVKHLGLKDVKLTIYPEAQHNCWTETYNNPELYKWFLAHERK